MLVDWRGRLGWTNCTSWDLTTVKFSGHTESYQHCHSPQGSVAEVNLGCVLLFLDLQVAPYLASTRWHRASHLGPYWLILLLSASVVATLHWCQPKLFSQNFIKFWKNGRRNDLHFDWNDFTNNFWLKWFTFWNLHFAKSGRNWYDFDGCRQKTIKKSSIFFFSPTPPMDIRGWSCDPVTSSHAIRFRFW